MASILLVEDDPSVREAVTLALQQDDHSVEAAASGEEALHRWRRARPDLVLLDVMLPGTDGLAVCRTIRAEDNLPIIMLTARTDPVDVVLGLELGADDYVTKPFETRVLRARVRAALRRHQQDPDGATLRFGDLEVDPRGMVVTKAGRDLALTPTELRLLLELGHHPGQVLTRQVLLERVWDHTYLGDSRLVDVCVQRLRSKVEGDPTTPRLIETVRGMGYKLVPPP